MIYDKTGEIRIWLLAVAPFAFVYFLAAISTVIAKSPVLLTVLFVVSVLAIAVNCLRFVILLACAAAHKFRGAK